MYNAPRSMLLRPGKSIHALPAVCEESPGIRTLALNLSRGSATAIQVFLR